MNPLTLSSMKIYEGIVDILKHKWDIMLNRLLNLCLEKSDNSAKNTWMTNSRTHHTAFYVWINLPAFNLQQVRQVYNASMYIDMKFAPDISNNPSKPQFKKI